MQSVWRDALRRAGGGLVVGLLLYPAWGGGGGHRKRERGDSGSSSSAGGRGKDRKNGPQGNKANGRVGCLTQIQSGPSTVFI